MLVPGSSWKKHHSAGENHYPKGTNQEREGKTKIVLTLVVDTVQNWQFSFPVSGFLWLEGWH